MSEEKSDPAKVPPPKGIFLLLAMIGLLFDVVLFILKWPIALLSIAMLPGLFGRFWDVLGQVMSRPAPLYFFMAGAVGYLLVWYLLSRWNVGRLFSTFEHELTHAIFALATLHQISDFKVTRRDGGHVRVSQIRNIPAWLIYIAPYFFPTLSVLLLVVFHFLPPSYMTAADVILGVSVSYHLLSTARELHPEQPDIKTTGRIFALLFLPSANLLMYGMLFSYALGSAAQFSVYMSGVSSDALALIHKATALF